VAGQEVVKGNVMQAIHEKLEYYPRLRGQYPSFFIFKILYTTPTTDEFFRCLSHMYLLHSDLYLEVSYEG